MSCSILRLQFFVKVEARSVLLHCYLIDPVFLISCSSCLLHSLLSAIFTGAEASSRVLPRISTSRPRVPSRTLSSPAPDVIATTAESRATARHPLNRQMISQKKPGAVFAALQIGLINLGLQFSPSDQAHCVLVEKNDLVFEADVVKIPRLNMYGVHFRRVRGPPQEYKDLCTEIIGTLQL